MNVQQAIDDLEAAVKNWTDTQRLRVNPKQHVLLCMEAEDVVVARFVDLLRLVGGDHVNLRDLVRRYEANTKALQTLLNDQGPQVMFLQMDD